MRVKCGVGLAVAGVVVLAGLAPVFAQRLEPISYEMFNGNDINANYLDRSYDGAGNPVQPSSYLAGGLGDLADGIIATTSWFAAESYAPSNGPYVGWDRYRSLGQPKITFRFGGPVRIDAVTLHADDAQTGGVYVPYSMRIAVGDTIRDFLTPDPPGTAPASWRFAGLSLTGSDVVVTVNQRGQWVMVSEIEFEGVRLDQTGDVTRLQIPVVPSPYRVTPIRIPSSMLPDCVAGSKGLQHVRVLAPNGKQLPCWFDPRTAPFVFEDHFDAGLQRWSFDAASCTATGGILQTRSYSALMTAMPHLNAYSVEARLKLPSGGGGTTSAAAGVVFGYEGWSGLYCGQTGSTAYAVTIDKDGCELLQLVSQWPMKSVQRWPRPISEGVWHSLRVLHQGGLVSILVDGQPVGTWRQPWANGWTWRDTSYIGASDGVGLIHRSGSAVQWDDVAIKNLSSGLRGSARLPATGDALTSLFVEVGCSITSGASSISSTFDFGDDFDDKTFDVSTWGILPMYQYPAAPYSNALPWLAESSGAQEFLCAASAPDANFQIYTRRFFQGRVRAQCRFSKGGYMYRSMMLADAPRDADRTFAAYLMFNDWGGLQAFIWSNNVIVESRDLDDSFFFRNYFGEVDLQIERNANGSFTFNAALEGPNPPTWTYTSRSMMPTSAPLHVVFMQSMWPGAVNWGGWRRYQDDLRVVDDFDPDITPPVTTVNFSPVPGASGIWTTAVTAALSASDEAGGVRYIVWSVTGAVTGSGVATGSTATLRLDQEGKSKLQFSAVDAAGNAEATQYASLLLDFTPPLVKWTARSNDRKDARVAASLQLEASDAVSGLKSKSATLRTPDISAYTKIKVAKRSGATSVLIDERARSVTIRAADPQAVLSQLRDRSLALPPEAPVGVVTTGDRRWTVVMDSRGTAIAGPAIALTGRAMDNAGHAAAAVWP